MFLNARRLSKSMAWFPGITVDRWGIIFQITDSRLTEEERFEITTEAVIAYLRDEHIRRIKGETYEGMIENTRKYDVIGCFGGYRFEVDVDTNHGSQRLRFIVTELTGIEERLVNEQVSQN